jgi:hypothetical protein
MKYTDCNPVYYTGERNPELDLPTSMLEHGVTHTGSKHALLVEPKPAGGFVQFTITNPDTGKRHASVKLSPVAAAQLAEYVLATAAQLTDNDTTEGK